MEMMQNAVSWVEIPVVDFERARKFYSSIYDYEMPVMDMGPVRMGFLLHEQGAGIGGAIVSGDGNIPAQNGPRIYLNGGEDLNTVLKRVEPAGGKIAQPKTEITPEFGFYAAFIDTEGNYISLHSMK